MIGALIELLSNYYQTGDWAHVEVIARTIRAAIPDDVVSLQVLGLAYLKTGRTSDAIRLFRRADRDARQTPGHESAADGGNKIQIEVAASACYREATRKDSGFGGIWYDLGVALVRLKRPKQAIWAFQTALLAQPRFPDALTALESAGVGAGHDEVAHDELSRSLVIESKRGIAKDDFDEI